MKIAGAVVPPCVPSRFRVMESVRIDESRARKSRVSLSLALRHVRTALTGAGVPHIDIIGRHIEITADDGQRVTSTSLVDPAGKFVEPHELGFIKRRIQEPAVRCVYTADAQAAAFGTDHP